MEAGPPMTDFRWDIGYLARQERLNRLYGAKSDHAIFSDYINAQAALGTIDVSMPAGHFKKMALDMLGFPPAVTSPSGGEAENRPTYWQFP
jgi:hypothetical protein